LASASLCSASDDTPTKKAGLKVFVCIFNRIYETGRNVVEGFKESMRIVFDKHLGQWNYVAIPKSTIAEVA
jgi:hypothetical protein